MHANERGLVPGRRAHDERCMDSGVGGIDEDDATELAVVGRKRDFGDGTNERLVVESVGDQVCDGDHREVVEKTELEQRVETHHGPVGVHDLADHGTCFEAGETGEVHAAFGLACADEHTTGTSA